VLPVNLSPISITCSSPKNPMPPELLVTMMTSLKFFDGDPERRPVIERDHHTVIEELERVSALSVRCRANSRI
jgi:hypothetical protein